MTRTILSCLLVALVALPACKSDPAEEGDTATASEAVDSTMATASEAQLVLSIAEPAAAVDVTVDGTAAALTASLTPSGCAESSVSGNHVSYTFNDCSGAYGLAHLSGTVEVDYTISLAGVNVSVTANAVSANGAELDVDASATFKQSGSTKTVTVTTESSGHGAMGRAATRNGSYTASWDTATSCVALDGSWSTAGAEARTWSTTVSDFEACSGACPTSGTIVYEGGVSGATITVELGGDSASFSTSGGKSHDLSLTCGPAQ